MGNTDSKLLVYKDHLLRLANEEIIPLYGPSTTTDSLISNKTGPQGLGKEQISPFDPFYTGLVSAEIPAHYLSSYLTSTELRTILTHNKANFTNLLHFLTYIIVQHGTTSSSLRDAAKCRTLTNCIRILTKLIPIMFESYDIEGCLEADIFWSKTTWPNVIALNSGQSEISTTAEVGVPDSPLNSPSSVRTGSSFNSTSAVIDFKASPQDSLRVTINNPLNSMEPSFLGQRLLVSLIHLSSKEGFTLHDNIAIRSNTMNNVNPNINNTVHHDIHFVDVLRLLITLFSKPLYKPDHENQFLSSFLMETEVTFKLNELISRLLKFVVRYDPRDVDPIRRSVFVTSLQFLNITMKFNTGSEQLLLLYFQNLTPSVISDKVYQPLQEILSIIVEGDELSNFQLCLPIFEFIFNLFLLNQDTCAELASQFGHVLLTTSIIYCKVISQERHCKPLQQFLAHFITYLTSLPQIHSQLSSSLKACQLSFLSEKVRNQPISIREFCIIQLSRHITPILTSQESVLDPCYIEALYNLIRIPSSLNYSTCMSIQSVLTTFHESIQLPITPSPHYSRSLSFKLDLLSIIIHALVSNILENFQHNKVLLFVLCRNEPVIQQLLQLIEDLSQDASRNKPLAPSLNEEEVEFSLPSFHGHKIIVEHLDFDYNILDNDTALTKLRPSWPIGISLRSKQKLRSNSKLARTWLGNKYAQTLIKIIQIVNSEFPSILKISRKEDLKRVLLHLKIFEPTLLDIINPILPLSLTKRTSSSSMYLRWDHYSWMQDEVVKFWLEYIMWSDIFNGGSGKVQLLEQDNDISSISSSGNNPPGTPTTGSRPGNRLERFNSNGSILSRTNTNDEIKPKTIPETTSSPWFKMPWSSEEDDSNNSNISNNNNYDSSEYNEHLLKPNIWTGTNIRLFPMVVDECESEFSFIDMTSSLLKRLRFNSTASINSMDTMHTINNYT